MPSHPCPEGCSCGLHHPHSKRNEPLRAAVAEAVDARLPLNPVAIRFGVSRERVRQLKDEYLTGKHHKSVANVPYRGLKGNARREP